MSPPPHAASLIHSSRLCAQVYGKVARVDGVEEFEWKHAYSKVYEPKRKYTSEGVFMSFDHYNVEVRDRVKCISGIEGTSRACRFLGRSLQTVVSVRIGNCCAAAAQSVLIVQSTNAFANSSSAE